MPLHIAIHGAAGRMGRRLIALAAADPKLSIVSAIDSPNHPEIGKDAGTLAGIDPIGIPLGDALGADAEAVIDFSLPTPGEKILDLCRRRKIPLVSATTGFDQSQIEKLHAAAAEIPLLWSPNMSLAVNLTMKLAAMAAHALKDHDADVEIIERHHRFKEDAPSGTALKFGRLIAAEMDQTDHRHGREGQTGKRPHQQIGYHAVRIGDNPGEHAIIFGMLGETVELSVRASNRDCYAAGALTAVKYLAGKKPGWYEMNDVLGI